MNSFNRKTKRRHGQAWPADTAGDVPPHAPGDQVPGLDDAHEPQSAASHPADGAGAARAAGSATFDVAHVAAMLVAAARDGRAFSYSELLGALGHRFTRPKMRALCKVLDAVDRDGALRNEPELAVLVVREGDHLPGQGWWINRTDYAGAWEGADARAHVVRLQRAAFDYWGAA